MRIFHHARAKMCTMLFIHMLQETQIMTDCLNFSQTNGDVYYVYPRIVSYMTSEKIKVEALAKAAGISANTVSKIRSGLYVGEEMIDACSKGMKSLGKTFNFEKEQMEAQGHYSQADVKAFIGNRPWQAAAKELGIEKHMLEWIMQEKKVSAEFHKKHIANKI